MRLIYRPAWVASLRQRCTSFSISSSSGESSFSGWRSMLGTSPATSQLDWLISMTAISVLSWSKAVRDRLRSFDCGMGHSIGLLDSAEGGMPSPLAPYHLRGLLQLAADLVLGEQIKYAGLDSVFLAHYRLRRWQVALASATENLPDTVGARLRKNADSTDVPKR